MVEISEVTSPETLFQWLEDKPKSYSVRIVHRMALRVLPRVWEAAFRDKGPEILLGALHAPRFLWQIDPTIPRHQLSRSSPSGSSASDYLATAKEHFKRLSGEFSRANASADLSDVPGHAHPSAEQQERANMRVHEAETAFWPFDSFFRQIKLLAEWSEGYGYGHFELAHVGRLVAKFECYGDKWLPVQADCSVLLSGGELEATPLWQNDGAAIERWRALKGLMPVWSDNRNEAHRTPAKTDWSFWVRWYDGLVTGKPLNKDLIKVIELELSPEDWAEGPKKVNAKIAEIEARYLKEHTRYGEEVTINPETGKFVALPIESDDGVRLANVVLKLEDVDEFCRQFGNFSGIVRAELFLIRRAAEHHANNAVVLHHNCRSALSILTGNIANGNCPSVVQEPMIGFVQETLASVVRELEEEPEVARTLEAPLSDQMLDDAEAMDNLVRAATEVADLSEGAMAEELPEDAKIANDPYQPRAVRALSLLAVQSRIVRAWLEARYANFKMILDESADIAKKLGVISTSSGVMFAMIAKSQEILAFITRILQAG